MSLNSIEEKQKQVVSEFAQFSDWEDRYKKIIEMGKALSDLPEEKRTEIAKVKGCQSQVWLHVKLSEDGRMQLEGDSDALIVKGLLALLLKVYNNSTPDEVLNSKPDFIKEIGFAGHLSPSRANGFQAMLKQIQMFAMAFKYRQGLGQ